MSEYGNSSTHLPAVDFNNSNVDIRPSPSTPTWKYFVVASIYIIISVSQGILLPLFISTFTSDLSCNSAEIESSFYFVLFLTSSLFNIPYIFGCAYDFYVSKSLTPIMMRNHIPTLILIGIFDGLSKLLIIFTSSLDRVSGDLQAIFIQLMIPFTLLFSKLLVGKEITKPKALSVTVVLFGVFLAIVPNIIGFIRGSTPEEEGEEGHWLYSLVYVLGIIPGVLMTVVQHKIFDVDSNYNKNWLLLSESFYQLITVALLFWTDLIPMFGSSKNLEEFNDHFQFSFKCFFDPMSLGGGRCSYSWIMGLGFAITYCGSYYISSYLIQYGSANFTSMVSAINTPIQIILWYTITPMTIWGCGEEYTKSQIIMGTIAIPFICIGAYYFHYHDSSEDDHEDRERCD